MPKMVSGLEVIKFLSKKGFQAFGRKGSHVKMVSIQRNTKTIVPVHKEISRGTLQSIIKQAKLTEKETEELLG